MSSLPEDRQARRYSNSKDDQRTRFERDRDRVLYSSAFRRLAGITQIVRAGEAEVFHTRQQHTLKVAQVGRRLAQNCITKQPDIAAVVGLDAEVVEAASLAHDLGHPPFGHVGEHVLNDLVQPHDTDGFEGNAQTFRIVTKLAVRYEDTPGLDLTRATLAACLKYPWHRDLGRADRTKKWGAYRSEHVDFEFARAGVPHSSKSAEAELMDWADDIAYSVHDLEDSHRCGLIPWSRVLSGDQSDQLIERAQVAWFGAPADATKRLMEALASLESLLRGSVQELLDEPYDGSRHQRQQLRTMTSVFIDRYIKAAKLQLPDDAGKTIIIGSDETDEVRVLKQITREYMINNPSLAAQQKGQGLIIASLFRMIADDSGAGVPDYLPNRLRYLWDYADGKPARFAADCISTLTEAEAVGLYARLHGLVSGSVLDPIVR